MYHYQCKMRNKVLILIAIFMATMLGVPMGGMAPFVGLEKGLVAVVVAVVWVFFGLKAFVWCMDHLEDY